jgi:hypothetical protein
MRQQATRGVLMAGCAVVAMSMVAACGDDDDSAGPTAPTAEPTTTVAPTTSIAATTLAPTTSVAATTTTTPTTPTTTTTTTTPATLEQPAIWPAADVVFDAPETAAADFVSEVLGVPPTLGEFRQGDSRSGEIEVLSPGEGDAGTPVVRGLLVLRQLGPDHGWFVLAAINDNASITTPESMTEVPAGQLTVEGVARGFEANVVVSAFVAGDAGAELDQVITMGGALETPEPFAITLDLSGASPGDVVALLVSGGAGLETDPGDFGAIPVVVSG